MAEVKVSQLPNASASTPSDYIMIVQNGVNKKISLTQLFKFLNSGDIIQFNPARAPIDIQFSTGNVLATLFLDGSTDFVGVNTDLPEATFHVNGNSKVGSSSSDGVMMHSDENITFTLATDEPQGIGYYKPLNAARETSTMNVDTGVSFGRFNLGNGLPGQYKTLVASSLPTGVKATVQVVGGIGFNRIDFTAIGQSVILKCVSIGGLPKWTCVGYYLANLYTV